VDLVLQQLLVCLVYLLYLIYPEFLVHIVLHQLLEDLVVRADLLLLLVGLGDLLVPEDLVGQVDLVFLFYYL
jgi:hypothetical protein